MRGLLQMFCQQPQLYHFDPPSHQEIGIAAKYCSDFGLRGPPNAVVSIEKLTFFASNQRLNISMDSTRGAGSPKRFAL
ncbi:hypothetical protein PGQ11_000629 [Apiospora arundinis]